MAYSRMLSALRKTDVMDLPNSNFYYSILKFGVGEEKLNLNRAFEWVSKKKKSKKKD